MSFNVTEINPCQSTVWSEKFSKDPKYQHIINDHKFTVSSYKEMTFFKAGLHNTVYEVGRKFLQLHNILDIVPYYYIDYLIEKNPKTILDLGCGLNIFKPYIPGIIGMDSFDGMPADIYDFFDKEY